MAQGWIRMHRKVKEHWLFREKREFSKFEAWFDMITEANHQDNKVLLGNEVIDVKRGSFITSELKLMERWGWSKTKLRSFLKVLESENMIIKTSDRKKTVITICNYCVYQDSKTTEELQKNHKKTTENHEQFIFSDNHLQHEGENKTALAPEISRYSDVSQTTIEPQQDHKQTMKRLSGDTNNNVKNEKKLNIQQQQYNSPAEYKAFLASLEERKSKVAPIYRFYEENGFGNVPAIVSEDVNCWIDSGRFEEPEKIIILALREAVVNGVRNWKYADRILQNWSSLKLRTVQDVEAHIKAFEAKKLQRQQDHLKVIQGGAAGERSSRLQKGSQSDLGLHDEFDELSL